MHRVEGEGVRKPEVRVQRVSFFAVKDDEKEEEWMRKRGG